MGRGSNGTRSGNSNNPQLSGTSNRSLQQGHDYYEMTSLGFSAKEARDVLESIDNWSGSAYEAIRGVQKGNLHPYLEKYRDKASDMAKKLELFIDKAPKWDGGTTFRGINIDEDILSRIKTGDEWSEGALASWSSSAAVARDFSVMGEKKSVVIRCREAQRGTSIKWLGGIEEESEVLVSSQANYRVNGKTFDSGSGITYIDVTPIKKRGR